MQVFKPAASAVPAENLTVRDITSLYLGQGVGNYSPEAQRERTRVLELFCAEHGHKPVSACRPADLLFWLNSHPAWKSNWTKMRIIKTVQRPFGWATRLGLIEKNPFAGVSVPPGEPGEPMTDEEYRSLLRHATACFRRVIVFCRFTGCRPGEMAKAEWSHLDLSRACITLKHHKTERTRKDKVPRIIVLHPVALKLLLWIKQHKPDSRYIFLNAKRTAWTKTAISMRLHGIRERAGVRPNCTLYGLRHKYGTDAILNDVNLVILAQLMGHASTKTTMTYIHLAGRTDHLQLAVVKAMGKMQ